MKLLEACVASPLTWALGWTLLHSLWEGALIAAALAALLVAVRSPRARYAAACLALLAMLAAFGVTLLRLMPEDVRSRQAVPPPVFLVWNLAAGTDTPDLPTSGLAAVVPWLAPCWILGVWVFSLQQVAGWVSVRRLRRRGVCSPPERWRENLAGLSAQLRISRPVLLLESCLADVPVVLGHFRPVILMPVGLLTGLPAAQIEAILLHELAHIRRYDYLVNLLQRAVEGLLFYHPAVWWISHAIRAERENCCDDMVVAISGNAHEYAVALAALEQSRWPGHESVMAATGGNLVSRIRRLLYPQVPNGTWAPLFATALLITTAGLVVAAWQTQPAPRDSNPAEQRLKRELAAPYKKWVDEDVVYIITKEERAAFQKLTTDQEREKFIEQFWLRRDPTPGTPENEFKEEHYRRIAYANARFAGSKPGWKTDRGRTYIVWGPPDEIDSHPSGGSDDNGARVVTPFETWRYLYMEGVGRNVSLKFVDNSHTGDYRLVTKGIGQAKPQ
jgi:GWxTD domain-containing protein